MKFPLRRTITSALIFGIAPDSTAAELPRWVVYYSNKALSSAFTPYQFIVLDSRYYPPLLPLRKLGKTIIGYASVGEASPDYTYFDALKAEGLLRTPSPTWKGNFYIDIRDQRWQDRFCQQIVPGILAKGFQGIFLDTLDSPLHLENDPSGEYAGMAQAAVKLISRIRKEHPKITLVLNRAYSLLKTIEPYVDILIGESVYSTFDFDKKEYRLVNPADYRRQVEWLQAALKRRPALRVFTLDYWNAADAEGISRIYREQRANGFSPYVSTIDLTAIVREPGI
jgi:uncharacterized protein (TIGR01370 family)